MDNDKFRYEPHELLRAELISDPETQPELKSWLQKWASNISYISENKGCGCCVDVYEVVAPVKIINKLSIDIVNDVFPEERPFFVEFTGSHPADAMRVFLEHISAYKLEYGDANGVVPRQPGELTPKGGGLLPYRFPDINVWVALLSEAAFEILTQKGDYSIERIVSELLGCSVKFRGVEFTGNTGWVLYEPHINRYFGGTESIRELIKIFGFKVSADSFNDAYEQWKGSSDGTTK